MSADRFKILSHLGRGGIGTVTRCLDTQTNQEVAVKRLLPLEKTRLNQSAAETMEREATALAGFNHPNIVTMHEFGEDEDGPFVVTELIDGESLEACVKQGAVSVEDFYLLAEQLLSALIAAQQTNLIHRDIKPANIMLQWMDEGGFRAKILDFGLSKITKTPSKQTLDQKGHFLCSIDYVSPEQIDRGLIDRRVDHYSLACVLYYSLVQKPPFRSECSTETLQRHMEHDFVPIREIRPDLPQPMAHWLERMMALEPADRPESAKEAMREFEAARDHGISPYGHWKATAKASAEPHHSKPEIKVTPRPEKPTPEIRTTPVVPRIDISRHRTPDRPVKPLQLNKVEKKRPKSGGNSIRAEKIFMPALGIACAIFLAALGWWVAFSEAENKAAKTNRGVSDPDSVRVIELQPAGNVVADRSASH